VAFTRSFGNDRVVVCVPRLSYELTGGGGVPWPTGDVWKDRRFVLPYPGMYEEIFTGVRSELSRKPKLARVFETFPLAVLLRTPSADSS
jgi:maltooligosyltrehalose synthase